MWIRKRKSSNGNWEGNHFYVSGGVLYYLPYVSYPAGSYGSAATLTTDVWHWFEILNAVNYHYFIVDGVIVWLCVSGATNVEGFDVLEGYQTSGKTLGNIRLDYCD